MSRAILRQVYQAARHPYAFPGGYAKVVVLADGELLCSQCAAKEFRQIADATLNHDRSGWCAVGVDVYWEGPTVACAHCGGAIESEYGDPEATD